MYLAGAGICRFEVSQLPEHKPDINPALVLRVLKITEPLERRPLHIGLTTSSQHIRVPDMPEEGELLPSRLPGQKFVYLLEVLRQHKAMDPLYRLWQQLHVS